MTIQKIRDDFAAWQKAPEQIHRAVQAALDGDRPIYIFGRNENSEVMARHLPVTAFVDDFLREDGGTWLDRPIVRTHEVPADAIIISAVLHRRPHEGLDVLRALPQRPQLMSYADFERAAPERVKPIPTVAKTRQAFAARYDEFARLADRLADAESQETFYDVMMYRLTGEPEFTQGYDLRDEFQYFDVPLGLPENIVFADGGGFKAETSLIFRKYYPNYGGIHFFEPGADALAAAKTHMQGWPNVTYHACGLGDRNEELYFDDTVGTSSCISETGNVKIDVRRLDDAVAGQRVDFIKYDIEGYEPKALIGAAETIRKWHPALAICVYHNPDDFLDVPANILNVRDDYRLALRHYTQGWSESVMYFIPER